MALDFTNYTFSGLIALLAAILGIGYPLFLESIRKIDEQYKSTRLSARFQTESVFRRYKVVLVITIVISFCAPFLMLLFPFDKMSVVVLTVQALAVLCLIFMMLAVFRVIQEYYNPNKLIVNFGYPSNPDDTIRVDNLSPDDLLCLVDLMRYSARRNNREVYEKCKSLLVHFINKEESAVDKDDDYNVSQDYYNAFRQIAEYSKDGKNLFFYNDNIASQVFYNFFFKYTIGPKTYESLWRSACIVAEGGSNEWFRQHWTYAVQYYTFRYEHHYRYDDNNLVLFREQHYMLGVLALVYERYDWLRTVLFHTHSTPPQYPLTPSTFSTIMDMVRGLEEQRLMAWQLTAKYQMKGLFAEVDSDDQLLNQVFRYASLLFIRLFSVNDYSITYSDPMELPYINPDAKYFELKKEAELVERIKYQVNEWFGGDDLKKVELPVMPAFAEVEALLNQYKSNIEAQIQYNKANPVLDKNMMEELKVQLAEADKRMMSSIPEHNDIESEDIPVKISIGDRIDNKFCAVGGYGSWSNYPDVLLSALNEKINTYYDGLLLRVPSEVFTVNEKHVFKVLEMLKPSKDEKIISLGIYLPNIDMIYNPTPLLKYEGPQAIYNGVEIESRISYQSSIIIIKRNEVPTITYLPPSDELVQQSLIELLDSPTRMFSNIDKVIADGQPSPAVQIGRYIRSHIPEGATCVRIVVNKNSDDTLEMARIESYVN